MFYLHSAGISHSIRSMVAIVGTLAATSSLLSSSASAKPHVTLTAVTAPAGGDSLNGAQLSRDGTTVTGTFITAGGETHAFRWNRHGSQDLGTLGGTASEPYGMSDDGSVVMGGAATVGRVDLAHAFRWTTKGMRDLGTLGGYSSYVWWSGISSDGAVVIGSANTPFTTHATRWVNGVIEDINPADSSSSGAEAISADGNIIAGSRMTFAGESRIFRIVGAVTTDLGSPHGDWCFLYGMSRNGAVLHGQSNLGAFRWSADRGFDDIHDLSGGVSSLVGASADGNVLIGTSLIDLTNPVLQHAYFWKDGVSTDLGTLGGSYSTANAVSPGGEIIVGGSVLATTELQHPYVWTRATGMLDLSTLISQSGIDVRNWTFAIATGIAVRGDDLTILGLGTHRGLPAAWILTISDFR